MNTQRTLWTAMALSICLPLLIHCGGSAEPGADPDAGIEAAESGAAEAGVADAAKPDSQGAGGADSGKTCQQWGQAGSDPMPGPLACNNVPHLFDVSAEPGSAETITVSLEWCQYCAWNCVTRGSAVGLTVDVVGDWAQVIETSYPCGSRLAVKLQTNAETTGGDLHASGAFVGLDLCKDSLSCPIDLTYRVSLGDAGVKVELVE